MEVKQEKKSEQLENLKSLTEYRSTKINALIESVKVTRSNLEDIKYSLQSKINIFREKILEEKMRLEAAENETESVPTAKEAETVISVTPVSESAPVPQVQEPVKHEQPEPVMPANTNPNIKVTADGKRIYIPQQQRERPNWIKGERPQRPIGTGGSNYGAPKPNNFGPRPAFKTPSATNLPPAVNKTNMSTDKKKPVFQQVDDKKIKNKRTLIRMGIIDDNIPGEERAGTRRFRSGKKSKLSDDFSPVPIVIEKAVITTEIVPIKILSDKIGKGAAEIVKKLFELDMMVTINSSIDFATADLIASSYGIKLEKQVAKTKEETLFDAHIEDIEDIDKMIKRPPIVTIMGHVDHGKTSLLDYIRKTNIAQAESGGITQHIGAYTVNCNGETITFLDTPGHEAFTAMRARGASLTDIAIIVVAADDGVMPQTAEAIKQAQKAHVSIIVAINKMDKAQATPERIMQQLTEFGLVAEEWGGDIMMVPVSAKTGLGIDKLLESILLTAELKEYLANPEKTARGVVVEAKLDKSRGVVATVLIQNGTLKTGNYVVAGTSYGKIKGMFDDKGRTIKSAGPSYPAVIIGLDSVPQAGDHIFVTKDEKLAAQVVEERKNKIMDEKSVKKSKNLDDMLKSNKKELNLIIKADVQGSVEPLRDACEKLSNDEVKVNVILSGVGAIIESDVVRADSASAKIIGFNVRPNSNARILAEKKDIDVRTYRIIYEAIDDVQIIVDSMIAPKFKEVIIGHAEVRKIFKITGAGTIAGSYVTDGKIQRGVKARVKRGEETVYEGEITSVKHLKDDVKEMASGFECGIGVGNYNGFKELDMVEAYILEEIKKGAKK